MAKPTEDKEEQQKKPLDISPTMMIALSNGITLIVIVIALIVMYVLLDSSIDKKIAQLLPSQSEEEGDEGEDKQEGILLDLGEFILNLADSGTRRYLKVGVAMELSKTQEEIAAHQAMESAKPSGGHGGHGGGAAVDPNASVIAEMDRYKPAIRDAIISVLSNKTSDELSTPTGKEIAKEEILELVNGVFEGEREVMRVSFGQFIIQ